MKKIITFLIATFLILLNCLTVTANTPIAIRSESDLKAISGKKSYYLANDITVTNDFTPISVFSGNFDGRGKKIINLKISKAVAVSDSACVGIFEKIDGATIKNLTLENVKISVTGGKNVYVGAICGKAMSSTITNCRVSGEFSVESNNASVFVGGIAGQNGSEINLCENSAKFTVNASYTFVGGIAGEQTRQEYKLEKCINLGNMTVSGDASENYVGGIVGKAASTVENCANYGVVKLNAAGYGYVGGIVASLTNGEINNCYNGGTLNCEAKTEWFVDPIATQHKNKFSNNFYFDKTVSQISATNVKTASALDSKSLSNASVFAAFDFNNIWKMGTNGPVLKCITAAEIKVPQQSGNEGNTSSAVSGTTSSSTSGTSSTVSSTPSNTSSTSSSTSSASSNTSDTASNVSGTSSSITQSGTSTIQTSSEQQTVGGQVSDSTVSATNSDVNSGAMIPSLDAVKDSTLPIWIFVVIAIVLLSGAGVFIWKNQNRT